MSVIPFPQRETAAALWDRYSELMAEVSRDHDLQSDLAHTMARERAHQRFYQAYEVEHAQAG
jgi:hypothetical protein